MPGERLPKQVPVNLLEAMDQRAPAVEQLSRYLRVLAIGNKALQAAGVDVELVPASTKGEVKGQALNTETIGVNEAAHMMVDARLDELSLVVTTLSELSDRHLVDGLKTDEVIGTLTDVLAARLKEIRLLANRRPD